MDVTSLQNTDHTRIPRVPNTPQRADLEKRRGIRELVFGAQDGVLTTMGLVTGLDASSHDRATLLIAGLLAACVGSLSMGVGEYLGGKSEREVLQNAIALEQREILEDPESEYAEQVEYYRVKGFPLEEAEMIVRRLSKNHTIWLHEMVRDEFGIDSRMVEDGIIEPALKLAASFAIGSLLPILPHLFPLSDTIATMLSAVFAAGGLFAIGIVSGLLSSKNPFWKGCEIVAFGVIVFGISYIAGRYVPLFFGHQPILTGA